MDKQETKTSWEKIVGENIYLTALEYLRKKGVTVEDLANHFPVSVREVQIMLRKNIVGEARAELERAINACAEKNKAKEAALAAAGGERMVRLTAARQEELMLRDYGSIRTVTTVSDRPPYDDITIKCIAVTLFDQVLLRHGFSRKQFFQQCPPEWIGRCEKRQASKVIRIACTNVRCVPLVIFPGDEVAPDPKEWGEY